MGHCEDIEHERKYMKYVKKLPRRLRKLQDMTQKEWDKTPFTTQLYRAKACEKLEYSPIRHIKYDLEYLKYAVLEERYLNIVKPYLDDYRRKRERQKKAIQDSDSDSD